MSVGWHRPSSSHRAALPPSAPQLRGEGASQEGCVLAASAPHSSSPLLRGRGWSSGTFFGVDTLECSELMLCLEAGLLGTCCASGRERPSTSARMHSWYSWDLRKRV